MNVLGMEEENSKDEQQLVTTSRKNKVYEELLNPSFTRNGNVFSTAPSLVLLPASTNLYDTPSTWLLKRPLPPPPLFNADTSNQDDDDDEQFDHGPDFASDNRLLRELLSWQFSDRLISVIIHRVGPTLILQKMAPVFVNNTPKTNTDLISGFNVQRLENAMIPPTASSSNSIPPTTSLEEQARLRSAAINELLTEVKKKKSANKLKHDQLLSKLHCKTLEMGDKDATRMQNNVYTTHEWKHKDHSVALTSDLAVYSYRSKPTSLHLRDYQEQGPFSKASVVRLFLDNVMAGVPQLAVCYHKNGLVSRYETIKTTEIPTRLNEEDPVDVREIERNATALLNFLKANCNPDLSIYWLFKGQGDRIARLWRLDPQNDGALDGAFRDKVLYQMSMLCLRSSSRTRGRERQKALLEKSVELLDCAADLCHGPPRKPLRAALRERLVDVLLTAGRMEDLKRALDNVLLANELLNNDAKEEEEGELASAMVSSARLRLTERKIYIACAMADISHRGRASFQELLYLRSVLQELLLAKNSVNYQLVNVKLTRYLGNTLNELGKCYLREGNVVEAKQVFQEGIGKFRDISDEENVAALVINVAHTYLVAFKSNAASKQLLELAIAHLEDGKNLISSSSSWLERFNGELARCHLLFGVELQNTSDQEQINHLHAALDLAQHAQNSIDIALVYYHLGIRYKQQKNLKRGKKYLEKAMETSREASPIYERAKAELSMKKG